MRKQGGIIPTCAQAAQVRGASQVFRPAGQFIPRLVYGVKITNNLPLRGLRTMNYKPINQCEIRFTLHEIRKSSKFVESIRQFELFLQNKPNFARRRRISSSCKTSSYKNEPPFLARKSQSQFSKRQNEHKSF
jgi:hypothetical protein